MKIYVITNLINHKQYVGQTRQTLKKRWTMHQKGAKCMVIHRAIRKYGPQNFSIQVVQECSSQEELNTAEIAWIHKLNSLVPNGYNIREGGGHAPIAESTKQKLRWIHLHRSEAWKRRVKIASAKRDMSWCQKLSQSMMGHTNTKRQLEALARGRLLPKNLSGERNPRHKINAPNARRIRELYSKGDMTQQQIAKKFGIHQITVSCIVRGKLWKNA